MSDEPHAVVEGSPSPRRRSACKRAPPQCRPDGPWPVRCPRAGNASGLPPGSKGGAKAMRHDGAAVARVAPAHAAIRQVHVLQMVSIRHVAERLVSLGLGKTNVTDVRCSFMLRSMSTTTGASGTRNGSRGCALLVIDWDGPQRRIEVELAPFGPRTASVRTADRNRSSSARAAMVRRCRRAASGLRRSRAKAAAHGSASRARRSPAP